MNGSSASHDAERAINVGVVAAREVGQSSDQDFRVLVDEPGFSVVDSAGSIEYSFDGVMHDRDDVVRTLQMLGYEITISWLVDELWEFGKLGVRSPYGKGNQGCSQAARYRRGIGGCA